jgi:uncharacterized membrane protein (UPF0127 family)
MTTSTSATSVELRREGGDVVCEQCRVAERVFARMKGLLGRRELPREEGLLLRPASAVHTFFMRFAIDVVFLDRELRVVAVRADLRPWRAAACRGARGVLELASGECARRGVRTGDRIVPGV